jgi:predicted O-linked N-acetylglucosamine transferase (SPINDLY family)
LADRAGGPDRQFAAGLAHHQAGRLNEAAAAYRQVLQTTPEHADALHLLGVVAHQLGDGALAIRLIRQAIAVDPHHVEAAANLGAVLKAVGAAQEAVGSLLRALALKPDHVEGHANLAAALSAVGRHTEALAAAACALTLRPGHVEALINRGNAALKLGRLEAALADCRLVVELRPASAEAQFNLGNVCQAMARLDEAIVCYRRALDLKPDFLAVLNNLGTALQAADRAEAALACFERVTAALPGDAEAQSNHAIALKDLGRLGAAVGRFARARALNPGYAEAHSNLGLALMAQGRLGESAQCYRHALALKPDYPAAHSNLLLSLQYDAASTGAGILAESRRWAALHGRQPAPAPFANTREPERRLRVGYVSADFRTHSVSYFFEALIGAHDPARVEATCYADVAQPDRTTRRLEQAARRWRSIVGRNDDDVAAGIRADGIDILVDLAGHLGNRRLGLFARRPAPVQATWLGYPGTTGLDAIDWRITDAHADPPGQADADHTERLLRLPGAFLCYRPPTDAPPVGPIPSAAGPVTFGSFNNLPKLTEVTVALWAGILAALPGSRLLLKSASLADPETCGRYRDLFAAQGIASDRIEMVPWVPDSTGHLGLYGRIDIALDTFPYHGTTTTCEALWMGVPVVTLAGQRHAARVGASILQAAGLGELVAAAPEDYVRIAVTLAADRARLAELRSGLRQRMAASALCDAAGFARNFEAALREMWRQWCSGAPARSR